MIKQRLGLEPRTLKDKCKQENDNSCGSLGLSIERDLIGNLLAADEHSIEDVDKLKSVGVPIVIY